MNMKELFENVTPEQKTKAINCKSAEELLKLAKIEGMDLSAEDAAELFSAMSSKTGEIDDDDLNKVSGGKRTTPPKCPYCGYIDPPMVVKEGEWGGQKYRCPKCKREFKECVY